jgi:hypothetical protein
MKYTAIKTLSLSVAFALSVVSMPILADDSSPPEQDVNFILKAFNDALGKPNARDGLIITNQHIYYNGDPIYIDIDLPPSLPPFFEGQAELQILLHMQTGDATDGIATAFPVPSKGRVFESTVDTTVLPPGIYQFSLVLVKPNGDATQVSDWFGGHGALLSSVRLKISANKDIADGEDIDGDGFLEGDANADGYVDMLMDDNATCNNSVLKGIYAYTVSGLTKHGAYLKDYVEVGFDVFDGNGNMDSFSVNNIDRATYRNYATYQVDEDCQGTVTYPDGGSFSMFVPVSGDEFYYLSVGETPIQSFGGREYRLTKMPDAGCSTATLNGVYSYAGKGIKRGSLWIETGFEYFDGQGNVALMYINNITKKTEYARGIYSVNPDCLGVTTYPDFETKTAERYVMFASPTGNEFAWMQVDGLQMLGFFNGNNLRTSRSPEGFPGLMSFANGESFDPQVIENMACNMPTPDNLPEGTEIKCGYGYEVVNARCELTSTEQEADGPLVGGPAAICPAGVMLVP